MALAKISVTFFNFKYRRMLFLFIDQMINSTALNVNILYKEIKISFPSTLSTLS